MFEELFNLLSRLGLGPAAQPVCELIAALTGETMTLQQLQQEIRNVLRLHGRAHRTGTVISALVELGLAGFAPSGGEEESPAAGTTVRNSRAIGTSVFCDSKLVPDLPVTAVIVFDPSAVRRVPDTARGWLDIDGGIYFDDRQHGAGTDSER